MHNIAWKPEISLSGQPHCLPPLDVPSNHCPHCDALSWSEERGQNNRWQCCENGKTRMVLPDSLYPNAIDALEDEEIKEYKRQVVVIYSLMTEIETFQSGNPDEEPRQMHTNRCKQFMESIVKYNNLLSFTSESADNIDCRSEWSTCWIQGSIYHNLPPLLKPHGHTPQFLQIYHLDSLEDQADTRMSIIQDINQTILIDLQEMLHNVNPYVHCFKSCKQQLDENLDPTAKMVICQVNPTHDKKGTHNLPTSREVAIIIAGKDDSNMGFIERDIVVETCERGLQRVPYWHPAYMALRYPLLLPFGEHSWHKSIPINGRNDLSDTHFLAKCKLNRVKSQL